MKKPLYISLCVSLVLFFGCNEESNPIDKKEAQINSSNSSSSSLDVNSSLEVNGSSDSSCFGGSDSPDNSADINQTELAKNKNLWNSKNIQNYTYDYYRYSEYDSFMNPKNNGKFHVIVIDGEVVSSGNMHVAGTLNRFSLSEGTVTYDAEYGYISSHSFSIACAYDSEQSFSVSNFQVIDENSNFISEKISLSEKTIELAAQDNSCDEDYQCQYSEFCAINQDYVYFSTKNINTSEVNGAISDLKYFSSLENNESFDCTNIPLISTSICTDNTCKYEIQ